MVKVIQYTWEFIVISEKNLKKASVVNLFLAVQIPEYIDE